VTAVAARLALAICCALASSAAFAVDERALAEKARAFRQALVERHLSPEGLVLYRVNLATLSRDLADGSYPNLADTPTFTGLFAATSCMRAEIETGAARDEALDDARRALDGLRFLMDVTGVRGLLARGVRRASAPAPDEGARKWLPARAPHQGWRFRADVSMDQYANGLLPAVDACRELFPEQSRSLAVDFAAHLLAHDFRLVDPDGRVTRYGDLSPWSALGWNSIAQLVAYVGIALAADLDADPGFARAKVELRDEGLVPFRARSTNLRLLGITNHSNDLMAWNLYRVSIPLAERSADPALPALRHGMQRSWLRVRPDGNAYLAFLHCRLDARACERSALARGLELLERFPLEKRKLAPPAAIAELPRRLLPGRKFHELARAPVPIELRPPSSFEWKSSPYRTSAGVDADVEYTGLDFLAAYWMWRSLPPSLRTLSMEVS
jgi:hypothetical protein